MTKYSKKITDGVILCRLVALIDPNALARPPATKFAGVNQFFSKLENLKIALDGAKKLGCNIVNVDPQDLSSGTPTLVLGLLAQIVRILLMSSVMTLANQSDETAEESLLRWVNFHLKAAQVSDTVTSFGELQDCRLLAILLHRLEPSKCDSPEVIMNIYDDEQRAEALLRNAEKIDCNKFISAPDIVRGNSQRLIPFLASIFLKYPKVSWDEVAMIKRRSGVFRSPSRFPNRNSIMMSSPLLVTSPRTTPQVTPVKLAQNFDAVSDDKTNVTVGQETILPSPKASPEKDQSNTNQSDDKIPNGKPVEEKVPSVVVTSDPDPRQVNNTNQNYDNDSTSTSLQSTPRGPLPPPSNSNSAIALNFQSMPNGTPKMTPSSSTNSFYPESNGDSVESLKNELLFLRSDRNTMQIELASLRTETEMLDKNQKADIKRLRELVKKLEDDKLVMAQKIDSLEMDLLRKKRESELRAKETEQLTEQLQALRQQSPNGDSNHVSTSILNKSVDPEGQDFLLKLRQVEDDYRTLEGELEALNKENTELYREREDLNQELETAKGNAARHKAKSENLEKLIASLQRDQSLSRQGSNVSVVNTDDLKLENDELKKSVDECIAKIAELEARENSLKRDLATAAETTRQKVKEQEKHLLEMFEARERDVKVQKDGLISELQAKIRQLENNVEKGPEVDRLLSTAKLKFDSKEQDLRNQFMQEMAQRDKLLRDKAEKVKELNKELAKAKKKEKRIEQFLSPPDEYEGWLYKQAKKNKVQRRWCVLRGETLFLYNDKKVKNWVKTAGALYIPNSVVKSLDEAEMKKTNRKFKYGFSIGSKYASRTYIFFTETEESKQDWVQSLEANKRYYESKAVLTGDISDATSVEDSFALPPPVMFFADDKKSQKSSSKSSSSEKKSMQQPISSSSSSSASSRSRSSSTVSSAKLQPEVIAEIMQMNSNSMFNDNNNSNNNVNMNNGSDDESLDSPVSRDSASES